MLSTETPQPTSHKLALRVVQREADRCERDPKRDVCRLRIFLRSAIEHADRDELLLFAIGVS